MHVVLHPRSRGFVICLHSKASNCATTLVTLLMISGGDYLLPILLYAVLGRDLSDLELLICTAVIETAGAGLGDSELREDWTRYQTRQTSM